MPGISETVGYKSMSIIQGLPFAVSNLLMIGEANNDMGFVFSTSAFSSVLKSDGVK
jgi:hypothetical protein